MVRVLHLIHSFNRGGIEKWLLSLLNQISRSQCEMDFCCKGEDIGSLAVVAQRHGAWVFHCPLSFAHLGFIHTLKSLLKEGNYDVLHNHLEVYSGLPVWIAHQLQIPVITSFHNTHFMPQTNVTRQFFIRQMRSLYGKVSIEYALRYSDVVTGCSQAVIDRLDPKTTKLQNRSKVLYYGVNIPQVSTEKERTEFRQLLGCSSEAPLILHVGRFIEQKNHLGVLSIFQLVLKEIPTAKLLLVGEGPLQPLIEHTIYQRQLSKSVYLLGLRDDVPFLMSQCDVFLFPSLYEGFGLAAIEANASNLTVVGTKIPGLIEAIVDGHTGLLHDVRDIEGMAQSTVKIIRDRDYGQQLARNGRTRAIYNFSIQSSATKLLEIYNSLVLQQVKIHPTQLLAS
jgi:glycosyltransferase EpsF